MSLLPSINSLRQIGRALLNACFPPDAIDLAADAATFESIVLRMRPKLLGSPKDAVALFSYTDSTIRSLIYALKYRNRTDVAEVFGACIAEYLRSDLDDVWEIVPVPLYPGKKRARGYNQSERVATYTKKQLDGYAVSVSSHMLVRIRDTESQTKQKSKKERVENMRGAFSVPDTSDIAGRRIILIDDVATTGATLSDAKRALRDAGAAEVRMLVIASGQ